MTYTTAQEGTSELVCSMYYPGQKKNVKKYAVSFILVGAEKGPFWDGTVFWVVWIGKMLCKYV